MRSKKASPSKGLIAPDFPYLDIAKEYKAAGAVAISCLTEPFYFQGSDQYLWEIASEVDIPVLRKDFVIDDYMILQAAAYGAAAVLLSARCLMIHSFVNTGKWQKILEWMLWLKRMTHRK